MDDYLMDLLSESVSSGDAVSSVSSGDNINVYYQVEVYTVSGSDAADPQYTLFDKPLEEYTVSEGLLLILVVFVIGKFAWNVIKEGFKFWSW
ncbi:MAG: hypothetical protein K2H85_06745 [Allobaculum sp.]|nr:hypothetical protein [Allobaculum sp.]